MKTIYKKLLFLLLLLPVTVLAQSSLEGVVLDSKSKQPIPGVNVVIQGASTGASTDFDGKFRLSNVKNGDKVVFSFIGYTSQTINFSGQKSISVSLVEEANLLQEVVVQVGYGTVKKKDATGSVDVVTSKDFNKGAILSADQLLTGKSAGVRITNSGGQPDSAPNIRIRGGGSLNASNNPLIVIDGVPISNDNPAGVSNPLSLINPNDIESFSILKDASATAIYGSRASNGVILITTKKGTSGDVKFNYSGNITGGKVGKKIDLMDSKTFTKFIQEFHPTLTNLLGVDDPSTLVTDDLSTDVIEGRILSNTDWQNEILRNSISTDHNISARANLFGSIPFRASIGYNNSEGVVKTNDYERFSYSLKLSPNFLNDHLKVDMNAKGVLTDKNSINDGAALGGAVNMDPTKPVYDNSPTNRFGGYYQSTTLDGNRYILDNTRNPLAALEQRTRPERALRFLGNIELDYKMHFLPELRAVVNLGLDASRARIRESFSENSIDTYRFNTGTDPNTNFVFNPGKNYLENQTITNTTWDSYLVYTKDLNGFLNKFDIQGGYSYQNFKNDGNREVYRYNVDTGLREVEPNPNNPTNRYFNELNLQSFFGRTNIDLAKKYLITLSLRADGSSLFREDKRWGYFPAAALAWKLKEESFVKNVNFVNDLKVRVGWGKTGQQDITGISGFYPSTPLFTLGSSTSQYLGGSNLYSADAYNEDLTWEKTTTYNLGIDFDFFKNNFVSGSFDVYKRNTTDLLAQTPVPPGQALTNAFIRNVGETESKGLELNLNFKPIQTENYNLELNANIAYNRTETISLDDLSTIAAGGNLPAGTGVNIAYHTVGFQPYSAWVFQQVYDLDGTPIVNAFVDRNGDNVITNDDRYYKALRPNWTFGFGLNFNYKNWDLSSSFRGQFGGQVYNARKLTSGWVDKAVPVNDSSLSNVLNFYSDAADSSFINVNGNIPFSDYFLEDATFLRCENIILGYRFNKFYKSSSLRVYGAVNNAFILTKYSGQDPENFDSIDNNFYPRPRMYTFGLSLDF
ncbi:SusC/RagA family TonB-linked outer membrane protein [Flavobacterium aquatile]|uniref:TonB-dependent receptor n=1 Tax=Flavobacterium aquatile LMG 4008 = ATCC 11947 TaxID=1453498 RepID=A0A095UZ84_9FLAO|nr:TonB-dependent receptor [Flavobacterium aquatile]KGD67900.1 TonB-dependent receptor [Flavobacterium aquatile LMG 4008 = ATCC 11947]GEC78986.1 SusC/RagA family TonB-linked outer membrane protein [Flavobacterium aquatile]